MAASWHLAGSVLVVGAVALVVFGLWYPWPYRILSGGRFLFVLLTAIDVVVGPFLTLLIFNPAKQRTELRRDMAVIILLQVVALGYGLSTVYAARPVALVFEQDRFRVIAAVDVLEAELPKAPEAFRRLPFTGPWLLGTRSPRDADERGDALLMGLKGIDIGQRPSYWQDYSLSKSAAVGRAKPVDSLLNRFPESRAPVEAILRAAHLSPSEAIFLPLSARQQWVVLLDRSGNVIGYAPFDGFF